MAMNEFILGDNMKINKQYVWSRYVYQQTAPAEQYVNEEAAMIYLPNLLYRVPFLLQYSS